MIEVTLDRMEMLIASSVGSARSVQSSDRFGNKKHATNKCDWYIDVDGAMAEMALAKYLGVYWGGGNLSLHGPDVAGRWRVRSTDLENGKLIIRPRDNPKRFDRFVLIVTKFKPTFRIMGWIEAGIGCVDVFKEVDAWWIPQHHLEALDVPTQ